MPNPIVAVFGGTGFLGRQIVDRLLDHGASVRVAARHAEPIAAGRDGGRVVAMRADLRDPGAVAKAVRGCLAAVNAVGLYVERGEDTFAAVHVEGARMLARGAAAAGLGQLVHISGLGADAGSESAYVRARALGDAAVREAFPAACILRPSVMFGADDAFIGTLAGLTRALPAIPLFGRGETRLQPVHVGDVAEAAARAALTAGGRGRIFDLGGPETLTYKALLKLILRHTGRRRLLVPVPFALWRLAARASAWLPSPPLTPAQVTLMARDNVAAPSAPGFAELGIVPLRLSDELESYLA